MLEKPVNNQRNSQRDNAYKKLESATRTDSPDTSSNGKAGKDGKLKTIGKWIYYGLAIDSFVRSGKSIGMTLLHFKTAYKVVKSHHLQFKIKDFNKDINAQLDPKKRYDFLTQKNKKGLTAPEQLHVNGFSFVLFSILLLVFYLLADIRLISSHLAITALIILSFLIGLYSSYRGAMLDMEIENYEKNK